MEISVREATVQDAPAITSVNIRTWQDAYREIVPGDFLAEIDTPEFRQRRAEGWTERIANPATPGFVALCNGDVGGYCSLSLPSRDEDAGDDVAELAAIYVAPEHQRAGLGAALMEVVLATVTDRRWQTITLWVFSANASAIAFYVRHGFVFDHTTMTDPRTGAEESRMRRLL
jgi:GNAT superfamily N-acetyltransferase